MAASPKLLSRVGNFLRGGPTEREESRTAVLQEVEDDLAGDGYGVNEELIPGSLAPITPDEKRDMVVSKHEDNDNYESWSPKGDPWSYELIAGDSRATSYIIATKDGKSVKIRADKMPEVFDKALSQAPSAIAAGFGREEETAEGYALTEDPKEFPDRLYSNESKQEPLYGESKQEPYGESEQEPYGESKQEPFYGESDPEDVEKSDPFALAKKINSTSGKIMQSESRAPLGGAKGADKKAQELRYAQSHPYGRELHAAKVSKLKGTSS